MIGPADDVVGVGFGVGVGTGAGEGVGVGAGVGVAEGIGLGAGVGIGVGDGPEVGPSLVTMIVSEATGSAAALLEAFFGPPDLDVVAASSWWLPGTAVSGIVIVVLNAPCPLTRTVGMPPADPSHWSWIQS